MASLPRRRRPSVPVAPLSCQSVCRYSFFQRIGVEFENSSGPSGAFGFKPFMHFGYYLMIAALALVGLEVVLALYQLATFVL
jgi:hypothetical protein